MRTPPPLCFVDALDTEPTTKLVAGHHRHYELTSKPGQSKQTDSAA